MCCSDGHCREYPSKKRKRRNQVGRAGRVTLFQAYAATLPGMLSGMTTADRYAAKAARQNGYFDVWDTHTETAVQGSMSMAESMAIDRAHRLSEIYRRAMASVGHRNRLGHAAD